MQKPAYLNIQLISKASGAQWNSIARLVARGIITPDAALGTRPLFREMRLPEIIATIRRNVPNVEMR